MKPCAASADLYSDTVTAVVVPEGFNGTDLVKLAAEKYGVAFGVGLGEVAGKVFRIGHLGSLTDVMMLSGLATAEMCMADLGYPIKLGLGRSRRTGLLPPERPAAAKAACLRKQYVYPDLRRCDRRA
jgi:alanine-glyoxylate transaminase/serine-glyoxylate transaminase/serine-pyruvate transaminase